MAELWGLRDGLRLSYKRGLRCLIVDMDSSAAVEAMSHAQKDAANLKTLLENCKFLVAAMDHVKFNLVF